MSHLTLQEVIDRINHAHACLKNRHAAHVDAGSAKHRPEFYVPRITRLLAKLIFSASTSPL